MKIPRDIERRAAADPAVVLTRRVCAAAAAAIVAAANLAACDGGCSNLPTSSWLPSPPPRPDSLGLGAEPEPKAPEECSPRAAQFMTAALEASKGAELRELADSFNATDVKVLLRLDFDELGTVHKATWNGTATMPGLGAAIEKAALTWKIPGVRRAGTCSFELKLPVHFDALAQPPSPNDENSQHAERVAHPHLRAIRQATDGGTKK
jgi:hypothetical protein